jgi:hypothetical protein
VVVIIVVIATVMAVVAVMAVIIAISMTGIVALTTTQQYTWRGKNARDFFLFFFFLVHFLPLYHTFIDSAICITVTAESLVSIPLILKTTLLHIFFRICAGALIAKATTIIIIYGSARRVSTTHAHVLVVFSQA